MEIWHTRSIEEVINDLGANPKQGLTQEEAKKRLERDGLNELPKGKQAAWWQLMLKQFANPLIYILMLAAAITAGIYYYELQTEGHSEAWVDTVVISLSVLVNVGISFYQEYRAGNIFKALASIVTVTSRVVRGGETHEVDSKQLAQGDIILLSPGMKVPADARIIDARDLRANEALLTGESEAVKKEPGEAKDDAGIGDRHNMVFMGTVVERGEARAVVVGTGKKSELGQIASLTQEAGEGEKTPLQERVAKLGKLLTIFVALSAVVIFVAGIFHDRHIVESFVLAVAVAVAGIPEGLPAALAVVLTVSMRAIYRKDGLVKKLIAAETLGSVSVICTDKTGTLTEGVMKVEELMVSDLQRDDALAALALANEAIIEHDEEGIAHVRGESTDRAKLEAYLAEGKDYNKLIAAQPRITTVPFSSERKYLASFHQKEGKQVVYVSGAPEVLMARASGMPENEKADTQKRYEEHAARGYRMIAVAVAELPASVPDLKEKGEQDLDTLISDLTFLGLVAIRDPIRPDVKDSLRVTRGAGVHVVMITGDHILTAKSIGEELGFLASDDAVMEGKEIDALSDEELVQRIPKLQVFARVNPEHKMRIVDAWQKHGQSVAMTGDGVNDAPALKAADIGIAVEAGTDVTKEAADLVLLNDSFTTITESIKQGRIAFDNVRKVVVRVLTNSFTELILILSSLLLNLKTTPVTAAMILWTNLVEDSLPDFALAFEPGEEGVMERKPLRRSARILNREAVTLVMIGGIVTDIVLLAVYLLLEHSGWHDLYGEAYIQTFIFSILGTNTLFFMYSLKSLKAPLWKIRLFSNKVLNISVLIGFVAMAVGVYAPFAHVLLGTAALHPIHLLWTIAFGVGQVGLMEIVKWVYRAFKLETDETEDVKGETAHALA